MERNGCGKGERKGEKACLDWVALGLDLYVLGTGYTTAQLRYYRF